MRRLYVANRGEIALRIVRAAEALGIETVIGASAADRGQPPAREATRAVTLGPGPAPLSYLRADLHVHAALACGADAVHPGYGFLSERASFARLCEENGLRFVGPTAEQIEAVGDKLGARALARAAGVPLSDGTEALADADAAVSAADAIGYPVLTKASAGGGGRGMAVARDAAQLRAGFETASAAAREAFGDGRLYLERFVERARHIEVQCFGDGAGAITHFGERDCSVQRRYQKMIEEAPAAILPADARLALHAAAATLLAGVRYRNAGTVEFLYDEERGCFSFMEVNARIQVEHPVSEMVTGRDLIRLQIELARGAALPAQDDVAVTGHAIEARILAEDPARGFAPSPGRISRWRPPQGEGVRVDSAIEEGTTVTPYYDSMIAKLVVHGADRAAAVERLADALARFEVAGIATNLPLLRHVAAHPDFRANRLHTRWLEQTVLPGWSG